ncbi:formate dehydrogenase accessory sulfurtransferase FdhD [Tepidibacter formicigenes]|jgi:FdhD protein|uniref:Sulfur carrier protein FdhD n=1 Tax=Tepidibacter formicigenes DSM 15518 TaxID=1123349 RepID=A0A1M6QGJ3_9FIRM|nr:formate dehydrogenase accessory sulfurtransferase FdhD [Tepidibacter formicigenes]SHK19298.1 FdhD protein [Tepidibacter formicigenes DSM 15518]
MDNVKNLEISRYKRKEINKEEDIVVVEYPFTIFLNDKEFVTLLCSPKSLEYLAVGFLASEGVINSNKDIDRVIVDEEKGYGYIYTKNKDLLTEKLYGKRTITSGCGKGTLFYNVLDSFKSKKIENKTSVNPDKILSLIKNFNKKSELFLQTGGVHSCGLCNSEKIILFEEDIGRHNALDKILGKCLIDDIKLKDKIILISGRISSEILIKIAKRKIPVVVSRSAPTDLAVNIARELNITLIGFARGEKMNIYSNFPSLNV